MRANRVSLKAASLSASQHRSRSCLVPGRWHPLQAELSLSLPGSARLVDSPLTSRFRPRPEAIRIAFEVHLIYLVEDGHHSLLNNFVLQCRNTQRTFPPVSLRYIDSPRSSRPVRSTMYPVVQIGEPTLQSGFILLPPDTIHPGCSLPLQ